MRTGGDSGMGGTLNAVSGLDGNFGVGKSSNDDNVVSLLRPAFDCQQA